MVGKEQLLLDHILHNYTVLACKLDLGFEEKKIVKNDSRFFNVNPRNIGSTIF